jgi:hypothetical protein
VAASVIFSAVIGQPVRKVDKSSLALNGYRSLSDNRSLTFFKFGFFNPEQCFNPRELIIHGDDYPLGQFPHNP